MDITDEFCKAVTDRLYGFCKVIRVIDSHGNFISEFSVDINEKPPFSMEDISKNNWHLVDMETDVRNCDTISAVTTNFWTCDCEHKFVRHISDPKCCICGTHINNSNVRLPGLDLTKNITGFGHDYGMIQ